MAAHRFGGIQVHRGHEPARFVGADGHEREVGGVGAAPDGAKQLFVVAGVTGKPESAGGRAEREGKPAPEAVITRSAEPIAPVAGGREGDGELGPDDVRLPPVQFDNATGAAAGEQGPRAERGNEEGIGLGGEAAQGGFVAMVVVIVAEQHEVDGRERSEGEAGRMHAARPAHCRGLARSEKTGSARILPRAVWRRNVEWPIQVATISSAHGAGGGGAGRSGTRAGQRRGRAVSFPRSRSKRRPPLRRSGAESVFPLSWAGSGGVIAAWH